MFFCEDCKIKNKWPGFIPQSYGKCEVCGKTDECYDVPSGALPPVARPHMTQAGNPVSTDTTETTDAGHYVISVGIKHVVPATVPLRGGSTERTIDDLLTTTVKAVTLPEAIRRAKAVIDVVAPPTT